MSLDLNRSWPELPLLVVDFEATSPDPDTCEPVEVAAVRFEGGKVVDQFRTLLRTRDPIPAESTAIHKITDEMVMDAPTLGEVAADLARIGKDALPCAFNAPYDRRVMHRYLSGTGVPVFDESFSWVDVFVIIASVDKYVSGAGRLKLGAACERHGVEPNDAHSAIGDATATGNLLYKLYEKKLVKPVNADRLLKHTDAMRAEQKADGLRYRFRRAIEDMGLEELEYIERIIKKLVTKKEEAE